MLKFFLMLYNIGCSQHLLMSGVKKGWRIAWLSLRSGVHSKRVSGHKIVVKTSLKIMYLFLLEVCLLSFMFTKKANMIENFFLIRYSFWSRIPQPHTKAAALMETQHFAPKVTAHECIFLHTKEDLKWQEQLSKVRSLDISNSSSRLTSYA